MSSTFPFVGDHSFPQFPVRRFTIEEYHRLSEVGLLGEEDRVELLEGLIVPKMIHKPPHDAAVELGNAALVARLPPGWRVRIQSAVTTSDSEPEPDLAVVCGSIRDHAERHPAPHEIALVVEVALSSLAVDRAKAALYARAGIAAYWIVNLVDEQIEVHEDPTGSGPTAFYRRPATFTVADSVPLVIARTWSRRFPRRNCCRSGWGHRRCA